MPGNFVMEAAAHVSAFVSYDVCRWQNSDTSSCTLSREARCVKVRCAMSTNNGFYMAVAVAAVAISGP